MAWSDELSDEQRRIASDDAHRRRLVAGPGTGKTRVLTRRVAYLIEQAHVEPGRILALTFSRAAAQELRDRLEALVGELGERPTVSTLHAFALRQLVLNAGAPDLPAPIQIADDYDERHVIEEELSLLAGLRDVRRVRKEIKNLASDWETLAAEGQDWESLHPNRAFLGAWRRHREVYGYSLRAELVYGLKRTIEQDPGFDLEGDYEHVLVDEYQDLNRCELAVIQHLVGDVRKLFVAGDDDQSIYGFRNAFPLGLREFSNTYPGSETGELVECYRCDRRVLEVALAVAEQDPQRIPKELQPLDGADEGDVRAFGFRTISGEAEGIARICEALIGDGVRAEQILILLRSDSRGIYSDPIVRALEAHGLQVQISADPLAILSEAGPRQLVCALRLLRSRADGLAWRELLALRPNNIGVGTLMALYRFAAEVGNRYNEALQLVAANPERFVNSRSHRVADDVHEINRLLDELGDVMDEPGEEGLERIADTFGLDDELTDNARERLTTLFAEPESTVAELLRGLQSARGDYDVLGSEDEIGRVRIMSMHAAKGLTADAVIVAACDDQLIPGTDLSQQELDDQRRLLYVSLSRARHALFVTYASNRPGEQSFRPPLPARRTYTRFLRDVLQPEIVR